MAATSRFGTRYRATVCALILASCAIPIARADEPIRFDIAAQPLVAALKAFAAQSKMQLLYEQDAVRHVTSNPVIGNYERQDALQKLLQGTGLEIVFSAENAATIRTRSDAVGAAHARTQGIRLAQAAGTQQTDASAAATQESSANSQQTLAEFVVTAQRREERMQDVPISISVLSGEMLDRAATVNVNDALQRVPGVSVTPSVTGGGGQIAIRGVTAANPIFLGSSPIAYYLDGVPFGFVKTALVPDTGAYDLERVEVLRGPQGTLYGATAQNGVVRVLTKDASLDAFELKSRASLSGTESGGESYRGDLAVNVPLIEGRLGARAVVGYQDTGGWIDRPNNPDANGESLLNLRLKLNAQATDALSLGFTAWASRSDFDAPPLGDSADQSRSTWDESGSSDYDMLGLVARYSLPGFLLTSSTSYLDYRLDAEEDSALTGLNILSTGIDAEVLSQEISLGSTGGGPWRWSVGGIYRDARDTLNQLRYNPVAGTPTGGYVAPATSRHISKSAALFGEITRVLAEGKLQVTGGLRYFEDRVDQRELSIAFPPARPLKNSRKTFDAVSPRLVLTWHPADDLTAYGSYSEGFRSGSDQTPPVLAINPDFPPADADTLKNYEVGVKGTAWGRRLTFDAALYYMDWQDVQTPLLVQVGSAFNAAIVNGTSASGLGFDLGVTAEPVDRLTLGVNLSMNRLEQDEDVISTSTNTLVFRKGERLNLSPETTLGGNVDYAFPLTTGGWKTRISGAVNYTSARSQRVLNIAALTLNNKPITIASARFTLESPNGAWAASLFGDNLNNERDAVLTVPATGRFDRTVRPRPRTVGVQLEYSFQ